MDRSKTKSPASRRISALRWVVWCGTVAFLTAGPGQARPQEGRPGPIDAIPGEILVKFKPSDRCPCSTFPRGTTGRASLDALNARFQTSRIETAFGRCDRRIDAEAQLDPRLTGWHLLRIDAAQPVDQACREFLRDPDVASAEPNLRIRTAQTSISPDDYYWSYQFEYRKTHFHEAWALTTGTRGITVAVIDTGIDRTHDDLIDNMWTNDREIPSNGRDDDGNGYVDDVHGWDFVYGDNNPSDIVGHGTRVAGIIGAKGNNLIGMAGTNFQCRLMSVKALGDNAQGTLLTAARAVVYAVDNGADVLNNSYGAYTLFPPSSLLDAFEYAHSRGVVAVAAAGNDGTSTALYVPANIPTMIAVTAFDWYYKTRTSWSNYGNAVDVCAPGSGVHTTAPGNQYEFQAVGTSYSSAFVSGLAALILSCHPYAASEVGNLIRGSAHDYAAPGWDPDTGYGLIDAGEAIRRTISTGDPRILGRWNGSMPTYNGIRIADLDRDGKDEILWAPDDGWVSVFEGMGSLKPGWPLPAPGPHPATHPSVGNLDADLDREVLIPRRGALHAWNADGSRVEGFPIDMNVSFPTRIEESRPGAAAAVVDLDGDGRDEIIVSYDCLVSRTGDNQTGRREWESLLATVNGDTVNVIERFRMTVDIVGGVRILSGRWARGRAPAVGDLDGDGSLEIVYAVDRDSYSGHADVGVWDGRGVSLRTWSDVPGEGCPTIGNADTDSELEVLLGVPGGVLILDSGGRRTVPVFATTPDFRVGGNVVSGRIDGIDAFVLGGTGDFAPGPKRPQLVFGTAASIYPAYPYNEEMPQRRYTYKDAEGTWEFPYREEILLDVTGDGIGEVIVNESRKTHALSYVGGALFWRGTLDAYPLAALNSRAELAYSTPAAGDLDGDGIQDLVTVDQDGYFTVWRTAGRDESAWPCWGGSPGNRRSVTRTAVSLRILPGGPVDVLPENRLSFSTEATDQFGAPIKVPVAWSADRGTITPEGLYTAPFVGRSDTVTAIAPNGVRASVTVEVAIVPFAAFAQDTSRRGPGVNILDRVVIYFNGRLRTHYPLSPINIDTALPVSGKKWGDLARARWMPVPAPPGYLGYWDGLVIEFAYGGTTLAPGDVITIGGAIAAEGTVALKGSFGSWQRGDADNSGSISSSDITFLVNYVLKGGTTPPPHLVNGDANSDGKIDTSDILFLVNAVFKGGPAPRQDDFTYSYP